MRPVNLIPPEERRAGGGPGDGALAYGIVGVLAVILLAVVAVVMTGNSIDDKKAELAALEAREQAAVARAQALSPYARFASVAQAREATVASLARSRFDWERVLRELALVIPGDVWLTSTTGTVSPEITVEGSVGNPLRGQAAGPALELVGCGAGQDSVATFVAALKDIDGVTRVGLNSSELPSDEVGRSAGGGSGEDCRTRDFIARFEILVAFDAVPIPAEAAPSQVGTPTPAITDSAVPGAAETQAAEQQAADSTAEQTGKARQAADIIPGRDR